MDQFFLHFLDELLSSIQFRFILVVHFLSFVQIFLNRLQEFRLLHNFLLFFSDHAFQVSYFFIPTLHIGQKLLPKLNQVDVWTICQYFACICLNSLEFLMPELYVVSFAELTCKMVIELPLQLFVHFAQFADFFLKFNYILFQVSLFFDHFQIRISEFLYMVESLGLKRKGHLLEGVDGTDRRLVSELIFLYFFPQLPDFFLPIPFYQSEVILVFPIFSQQVRNIVHQILTLVPEHQINVRFHDHFVSQLVLNPHLVDLFQ